MQSNTILPETGFVRLPTILKVIPISKTTWWLPECITDKFRDFIGLFKGLLQEHLRVSNLCSFQPCLYKGSSNLEFEQLFQGRDYHIFGLPFFNEGKKSEFKESCKALLGV